MMKVTTIIKVECTGKNNTTAEDGERRKVQ